MILPRKPVTLVFLLVLLVAAFAVLPLVIPNASAAQNQFHRYLSLSALPPQLPTSSSGRTSFPALVVSVTDAQGKPLISPNATTVYLSSSQSAVLSVQSTVTIQPGAQYALADVYTTATPGNSTVTAVSPGFESDSIVIGTFTARGYPTQLSVFALPGSFHAGAASTATFSVVVLDAAGLPARTIQDTSVTVISSDTGILTVSGASIPVNQTVAYGTMQVTGTAGSAAMTASASGFVSSSAVVSVVSGSITPVVLQLTPPPTGLPADGGTFNVLTVSLLDNQSRPEIASSPVQVYLSSSRPDIATMPSTVVIPTGQSFVTIPITTSSASGSTDITASALNFVSSFAKVSTVDIPPTKLGIYLADSSGLVPRTAGALDIVVQLQDASGVPAEARTPANVIISFSNTSLLQTPLTLTIPKGTDLAYTQVPIVQGTEGIFTAVSNGLNSASARFSATDLPVTHSLSATSTTVQLGQSTTIFFSVQLQGQPVSGASIDYNSNMGILSPDSSVTDGSGLWTATFRPSTAGVAVITVSATDSVIGSVNATMAITVVNSQAKQPDLLALLLSFPYYLVWVVVAAAVVVILLLFIRRRRRAAQVDEAVADVGEQVFNFYGPESLGGIGAQG